MEPKQVAGKQVSKPRFNGGWIIAMVFFISTLYHSRKFTKLTNSWGSSVNLENIHEIFPFIISGLLLICHYCLISNVGYIELYLDSNDKIIDRTEADVENQQSEIFVSKTRKVYYLRYICWLFAWPLLIFTIQIYSSHSSIEDIYTNPEYSLLVIILSEAIVSALLITSFTYTVIKAVFGILCLVVQVVVLFVFMKMACTEITTATVCAVPVFFLSWIGYVLFWMLNEATGSVSDDVKVKVWGVLDVIQFVVIPLFLLY